MMDDGYTPGCLICDAMKLRKKGSDCKIPHRPHVEGCPRRRKIQRRVDAEKHVPVDDFLRPFVTVDQDRFVQDDVSDMEGQEIDQLNLLGDDWSITDDEVMEVVDDAVEGFVVVADDELADVPAPPPPPRPERAITRPTIILPIAPRHCCFEIWPWFCPAVRSSAWYASRRGRPPEVSHNINCPKVYWLVYYSWWMHHNRNQANYKLTNNRK